MSIFIQLQKWQIKALHTKHGFGATAKICLELWMKHWQPLESVIYTLDSKHGELYPIPTSVSSSIFLAWNETSPLLRGYEDLLSEIYL